MHEPDDHALLRQFAEQNSEAAFAALVARHVDKVYSTALRHTRNAHAAEEITQAVFVILAKKSGRLGAKVILAGWLYETARLTAVTFIRSEIRRARREQEAHMQTALNENDDETWPHIAPLLDDALAGLSAADRHAVVLRYFDGKSLGEVGTALGASEDAAKKRVTRAVEKLRGWFTKRGVMLTATVLTAAISANSVQAAPVGLAKAVTLVAMTKGVAASGSTLALIKGALKIMAWTKAKMAIAVGVGVLLAAGTTTMMVEKHQSSFLDKYFIGDLNKNLEIAPPVLLIRPTHFSDTHLGANSMRSYKRVEAIGRNASLDLLMNSAYGVYKTRMFYPGGMPTNTFDYLVSISNCPPADFQAAIKRQIGWAAHFEMRDTDVLLLRVKQGATARLKPSTSPQADATLEMGDGLYRSVKNPLGDLFWMLEVKVLNKPVVDQTGLKGDFDFSLDFSPARPGESKEDALFRALPDQLGLELVPTNMPIEMLVVEKVK